MNQQFIINAWNVWPPVDPNIDKDEVFKKRLSTLPKILKRRLTPLARTVFAAAIPCMDVCTDKTQQIATVFSSTHGELEKSFNMMQLIEAGEEISPTAFSLSVHNAIAGLFSMAFNNHNQCTVVAPGEEGIVAAFIEAIGLLQEGEEQVLIVFYDEPLVEFYPASPYKLSADQSNAIALLISAKGEGLSVQLNSQNTDGDNVEQPLQIIMLMKFLVENQDKLLIHTPRHSWCFENSH